MAPTTLSLVLACILASCGTVTNYVDPGGPEYFETAPRGGVATLDSLRVVSFNIKLSQEIEQAIEEYREDEQLRDADVIFLQEMDIEGVRTIAELLDFNYVYHPASVHFKHDHDFGNAVLCRWPLKDPQKILLPHSDPLRKQRRIATAATAVLGDREVRLCCVHTEMFRLDYDKRIEQVQAIADTIDPDFELVIVGGDFNTVFGETIRDMSNVLRRSGFVRATRGVGWTSAVGPFGALKLQTDHIFTRGFTVVERGRVNNSEASDHRPIWVVLTPEISE